MSKFLKIYAIVFGCATGFMAALALMAYLTISFLFWDLIPLPTHIDWFGVRLFIFVLGLICIFVAGAFNVSDDE